MVKNLKFLLLAAIVLFAAVALAHEDDDEHDERRKDLGDGERECGGVSGNGFRAFKVSRTTSTGTDTIVFSFRAFPVPRIRVRYFDGEVADADVEDNEAAEKLELVASIPGFFLYTEDATKGYQNTETITQRFNLRRANGDAWAMPVLDTVYQDSAKIFKLTVCRKVGDFCFESYVANDTVTYNNYELTADAIKFNVLAYPGSTGLTVASTERLAVVVKVHYKDGLEAEDNSEENEELELAGSTATTNDLAIGTTGDEIAAYFNWEKTVTVTSASGDATADILSSTFSASELKFDRRSSGAGSSRDGGSLPGDSTSGSSDFDDASEESDNDRETADESETYTASEEDDAVEGRLSQDKIFVFAIDADLSTATKVVWDPDTGATSVGVSANAADSVSITLVKVLVAAFAFIALFM